LESWFWFGLFYGGAEDRLVDFLGEVEFGGHFAVGRGDGGGAAGGFGGFWLGSGGGGWVVFGFVLEVEGDYGGSLLVFGLG